MNLKICCAISSLILVHPNPCWGLEKCQSYHDKCMEAIGEAQAQKKRNPVGVALAGLFLINEHRDKVCSVFGRTEGDRQEAAAPLTCHKQWKKNRPPSTLCHESARVMGYNKKCAP